MQAADPLVLVRLAQAGDLAAFEALVRVHQARVRRQLRRLVRGDDGLADDLAQDTFLLAWRQLRHFRGEAKVSTWLHRIALNVFLAQRRRRREEPWPGDAARRESEGGAAHALHAVCAVNAVNAVAADDDGAPHGASSAAAGENADDPARRIDIERAVARLSEPQRLAVIHCFQLDLSHDEAAAVLGWPLGTLKSHVARAKAALRVALAAWQPQETGR